MLPKHLGQSGWPVQSKNVQAFITRTGGQLGPVTFQLNGMTIEPLHVAPWTEEKLDPSTPAMLRALRGDFFCMPFGGNDVAYRGETHPPHGQTANLNWSLVESTPGHLHLSMTTTARQGQVDKHVHLPASQTAVYQRHIISKMTGPMSFGHHAMLGFPDPDGSGLISTSPIQFGKTTPAPFERPENKGYSMLRHDTEFQSLHRVSCITTEMADLSRYPARRGFEDLVMLANQLGDFAWTAVVFPKRRYVWFALKDPRVLPSTILWLSNGGRHYAPWNGRHVNVMGLEEVCSYFHYGLSESVKPNPLSKRGVPTFAKLDPKHPKTINYIMAVASVPNTFTHVDRIEREDDGVTIIDRSGRRVQCRIDTAFLDDNDMANWL